MLIDTAQMLNHYILMEGIINYPNSTLMCCELNNAENGETIFIDAKKVADILKDTNLEPFNKIKNFEIIHERSG